MRGLKTEDRLAVGIFIAYLLFVVASLWFEYARSATSSTRPRDRQEQLLDRLERGETVRIPRWHGHELELSGSLIVDADQLDDEQEGDDGA